MSHSKERNKGTKTLMFRANMVEVEMLEGLARLFPDVHGNPNMSEALHFVCNFFIWQSQSYPGETKVTLAGLYDFWSQFNKTMERPRPATGA